MNNLLPLNLRRLFSSTNNKINKAWKLVETRKVKQQPLYKVGDVRPNYIPRKDIKYPAYPYGESHVFKQSNTGLYGGGFIQYGNSISESKHKTRRRWMLNVIHKSLWSEALNRKVPLKLTAKVLRTISHEGGLDNYLTKDKSARIKELGPLGWKLRYRVLMAREAIKVGDQSKANIPQQ